MNKTMGEPQMKHFLATQEPETPEPPKVPRQIAFDDDGKAWIAVVDQSPFGPSYRWTGPFALRPEKGAQLPKIEPGAKFVEIANQKAWTEYEEARARYLEALERGGRAQ